MSAHGGPNIVEDGLVLALDAANVKSFRGEPTTNLAYNVNGTIDWAVHNLTALISQTAVVVNSVYRITSTTGGSFRMNFNLGKLANGQTYTISYKYKIISGGPTFSMSDWNDAGFISTNSIDYGDYIFSTAQMNYTGYSSTYRFMDFNISANTVVEFWDLQLEQKPYYTPFVPGVRGTTVATGGGWADMSGLGNHGSLVNSVTYNSEKLGSLVFDATNERVDTNITSFGNNTTWSAWVNRTTSVNDYNMFMGRVLPYFGIRSDDTIIFSNSINGTQRSLSSTQLTSPNGKWFHLTFTTEFNGTSTTMRVYVDGLQTQSGNWVGTQSSREGVFTVGEGRSTGSWYPFNGKVANVMIYNKTLTSQEVLQNYNATKGRYGL